MKTQLIIAACASLFPALTQAGEEKFARRIRTAPHTAVNVATDGETIEAGIDLSSLPIEGVAERFGKSEAKRADAVRTTGEKIVKFAQSLKTAREAWERAQLPIGSSCSGDPRAVLKLHLGLRDLEGTLAGLEDAMKARDEAINELRGIDPVRVASEKYQEWGALSAAKKSTKPLKERERALLSDAAVDNNADTIAACNDNYLRLESEITKTFAIAQQDLDQITETALAFGPSPTAPPPGRFLGSRGIFRVVGERNKDTGLTTLSEESSRIGFKGDVSLQWGKGSSDPLLFKLGESWSKEPGKEGPLTSGYRLFHIWQAGLSGEWKAARYTYRPLDADDDTKVVRHDWKLGVTFGLFAAFGRVSFEKAGAESIPSIEGKPENSKVEVFAGRRSWLWGPQLRLAVGRTWKASEAMPVLDLPDPIVTGPIAGESRVVGGPKAAPELTALIAVPFQPPGGHDSSGFAFGPALRMRTTGAVGDSKPWGASLSVRPEFWFYWHTAADEKTASIARVGVAPFVDRRINVKDDGLVRETLFGALIELRTGTNALRLTY